MPLQPAVDAEPWGETDLCERFERRVYLYGLRHLRDTDAAKDLAQEVLQLVIEKLRAGEVRDTEQLASFVLGTARHVVMASRRTEQRRARLLTQYADPRAAASTTETGPDVLRLQGCLMTLQERERDVVLLSFYAEQEAAAVAAELGLSASNVRVIRHRAIHKLRDCMGVES